MPSQRVKLGESLFPITTRIELADSLDVQPELIQAVARDTSSWYSEFTIPKASGGVRLIRPPRKLLRRVQRAILRLLYSRLGIPSYLHGGVPRRSIFTHAKAHVGRLMVATLDIRSFFPSTNAALVRPVFERASFGEEALADAIALTMLDDALPQGAPTSSLLANLAFGPIDGAIIALCKRRRLSFSRYVDDIAISGNSDFCELKGPFIDRIRAHGYDVADEKVKFMRRCDRQVVTGLVVNEKLRPTSEFIKTLTAEIRLCLERGPDVVGDLNGLRVRSLKARLTGRVAHVCTADPKRGKRLRGMLCGVDWFGGSN